MRPWRAVALGCALAGLACLAEATWLQLKPQLAQWLIARAWRAAERGASDARPWPWADTRPIARLVFEGRAARELFVLEGSSGRNLAFGPAHDPASVLPGERGNSVIAGHRDTSFRFLEAVRVGDRLRSERRGRVTAFVVSDVRVADANASRIALASERARLTLTTCYPFDAIVPGGALRWVVTADAVPAAPAGPATQ
jgi:sortase A